MKPARKWKAFAITRKGSDRLTHVAFRKKDASAWVALGRYTASEVEIRARLVQGRLTLQVSDDGIGQSPEGWSHGLGLGGVRKRVKLLGGQVQWLQRPGRGIQCEVQVPLTETTR